MEDWAEEMAREWCASNAERLHYYGHESATGKGLADSLAALLREVRENYAKHGFYDLQQTERKALLAEVRRVVAAEREAVRGTYWVSKSGTHLGDASAVCDEILSRLEDLK